MCRWVFRVLAIFAVAALSACSKNSVSLPESAAAEQAAAMDEGAMIVVPAGDFIMGSNKVDKEGLQQQYGFETPLYVNEHPQRKVHLDSFKIDTYEVSNGEYKEFLLKARGRGHVPEAWRYNGYGLARSQADAMDVATLRNIAVNHFKLDMDTRTMDKAALIAAMFKQQQIMDKLGGDRRDLAGRRCLLQVARQALAQRGRVGKGGARARGPGVSLGR